MVLTGKQQRALASAPKASRARMIAGFRKQDTTSSRRLRARSARVQRNSANLTRMPANPRNRGSQPDMSRGNWGQTPSSSNVIAPRGFGYYDAFEHDPYSALTHQSIGPATPILASTAVSSGLITRKDSPLDGGPYTSGAMLLLVYPSTSPVQARLWQCSSSTGASLASHLDYTSPQLLADPPDNAIPTRCSLRIRNWTQQVGLGGIVRVLRLTTGVTLAPSFTTNAELAALQESIRNHARTRAYAGEELTHAHQKNCTVVDQSKAVWFTNWDESFDASQYSWASGAGITGYMDSFTYQTHDPSYSPLAILFEPFVAAVNAASVGNVYEVSIRSQFMSHYAQGTILANMAVDPRANPMLMLRVRNQEEGKGSMLERISNLARRGVSAAWNSRDQWMPKLADLAKCGAVKGAAGLFM